MHSFLGCEVSPLWGHTTVAGCLAPPEYDTYYAIDFTLYDETGTAVRGMTATEIYEQGRDDFACEFLAVNHPYRGQATFDTYDVTAESNPAAALPDLDLRLVHAVEVYNKTDGLDVILDQNLPTWFNLLEPRLRDGRHRRLRRARLQRELRQPAQLGPRERDGRGRRRPDRDLRRHQGPSAARSWRGPFLRIDVDGAGMGETVAAPAGVVTVHVEVLAPEWMGLGFANLYANGEVVGEMVPLAEGDVVRLDESFELSLEADAHLVLVAGSLAAEHDMNPVSGKNPLSVTNPVFVDVDGDGYVPVWADMQ